MQETATFFQALFNVGLWGLIVLVLRPALKYPYCLSNKARMMGILLILVFCLFPFWGRDYFHYMEAFRDVKIGSRSNLEPFYEWIIVNVADYYVVFRLIVWGLALILLLYAYKRVFRSFDLSLFYFAALYLPWFSYARASLAISSIILGITFLTKPLRRSSLLSILIGFSLIAISIFFHRSAVLGIAAVVGSILIVGDNKYKLLLILVSLPVAVYFVSHYMDTILLQFIGMDSDMDVFFSERKVNGYLMGESNERGLGGLLGDFLNRGAVLIMPIAYTVLVFKGYYQQFNRVEKLVSAYTLCVIFLAIGLVSVGDYNMNVLFYRTLFFSYPANAVFLMSIKNRNLIKGIYGVIYYVGIVGSMYALVYSTYCALF